MTATLSTSPRAQRAARRGEASRLQEQQQREEQAGQEGGAALGALADGVADAGAEETGLREDAAAVEPGLTLGVETVVAAAADSTGVERVARPAAETAAASDDGLVSPAAARPAATPPPADEGLAAEEAQGEQGLADPLTPALAESPPALEESEIAAVVAEAARQQGQPPSKAGAPTAAESAGTPAAAGAVNTQEHGQAEGGIEGPANAVASGAAPARRKTKLRAQPAPRRPGAGLGPGAPGSLLGWLRQGQSPPVQAYSLPSAPQPVVGPSMRGNIGTWRDRHDRPERVVAPMTGGEDGSDNSQNGSEFIPSHSEASEEVSLGDDENQNESAQRRVGRGEQGGVAVIAYADDITVVGPREDVFNAFDAIVTELAKRGLRCNVAKSSAWGPQEGDAGQTGLPHGLRMSSEGIKRDRPERTERQGQKDASAEATPDPEQEEGAATEGQAAQTAPAQPAHPVGMTRTATEVEGVATGGTGWQELEAGVDDEPGRTAAGEGGGGDGRKDRARGETDECARGGSGTQAPLVEQAPSGAQRARRQHPQSGSPRRLGTGLAPARPGPLVGWAQQVILPPQSLHDEVAGGGPSSGTRRTDVNGHHDTTGQTEIAADEAAATEEDAQVTALDRRRVGTARQRLLRERAAEAAGGTPPARARGAEPPASRGRGGRGARGRGGLAAAVAREKARSGTWRERHGRPERQRGEEPMNDDQEDGDEDYMEEEQGDSEDASLEDEGAIPGNRANRRAQMGGNEANTNEAESRGVPPNEAASKAQSPADIAADSDAWRQFRAALGRGEFYTSCRG
ncbi:unnamed protein product [Closterium sp. Naga37s-1]|nr:unnamed protein product [Closterium sp. Naga37s-1]